MTFLLAVMEPKDWIAAGALVISLCSLLYTYFSGKSNSERSRAALAEAQRANELAGHANAAANRSNKLAEGEREMRMIAEINNTHRRYSEILLEIDDILDGKNPASANAAEKRKIENRTLALDSTIEQMLNLYEVACASYRDDKCDRERFKRLFQDQIKNLFDSEAFSKEIRPGPTTRYQALQAVYEEWFHTDLRR